MNIKENLHRLLQNVQQSTSKKLSRQSLFAKFNPGNHLGTKRTTQPVKELVTPSLYDPRENSPLNKDEKKILAKIILKIVKHARYTDTELKEHLSPLKDPQTARRAIGAYSAKRAARMLIVPDKKNIDRLALPNPVNTESHRSKISHQDPPEIIYVQNSTPTKSRDNIDTTVRFIPEDKVFFGKPPEVWKKGPLFNSPKLNNDYSGTSQNSTS